MRRLSFREARDSGWFWRWNKNLVDAGGWERKERQRETEREREREGIERETEREGMDRERDREINRERESDVRRCKLII